MAAPRATQFIALRNLTRGTLQNRQLHTIVSPVVASRPTKQEPAHKTPTQHSDVNAATRAFSLSSPKQAARDQSTIDFFYFPSIELNEDESSQLIRVPILPDNFNPPRTGAHAPEAEFVVHKPEINVMSMDSVYLPMAENHDGHAIGVDFHAMADRVAANVRHLKVPVEEQASMMKQLWSDMVDDLLGLKKKALA